MIAIKEKKEFTGKNTTGAIQIIQDVRKMSAHLERQFLVLLEVKTFYWKALCESKIRLLQILSL